MPLASVPTRSELMLRRLSRWSARVDEPLRGDRSLGARRVGRVVALIGALALPAAAWAQVPGTAAGAAYPPSVASPAVSASPTSPAAPAAGAVLSGSPIPPAAPPAEAPPPVPPAAAVIPAISRLPEGVAVQARAGMLELLGKNPENGQTLLLLQLPLAGTQFATLLIGEFLYIARGESEVLVVDVRSPLHPVPVASFQAGGPVTSLWGGTGTLAVVLSEGTTLLFDVHDPRHPVYQSLLSNTAVPQVSSGPPGSQLPELSQHRQATSIRPFLFFANRSPTPTSGGAMLDFSYQYAKIHGLWWGIEVAPLVLNTYNSSSSFPLRANSRVWFGYSGRLFAFAAAMGSGVTDDQAWFQLGPVMRLGHLNGVHSTLRLLWSALLPLPYPVSGEFNLEGPVSKRLGLRFNFTGDSALSGFYTTLGTQFLVGGDHRWQTTVLTTGLGFSYMRTNSNVGTAPNVHHPGVILSFTVEPRW